MIRVFWFMICNRRALFFSITLIALPAIITTAAHAQNATQTTSVVTANTRFAFKLFDALTTKKSGQSMLVAPTGMSLIFALLDNVADAEARKEIEQAFEFTGLSLEQVNEGFSALRESIQIAPPKNDDTTKVDDACRVEAHPGCPSKRHCDSRFDLVESRHPKFQNAFTQLNQRCYGTDLKRFLPVPSASLQVSRWARERTRKDIAIELSQGEKASGFLLVDVTHFHSFWEHAFSEPLTKSGPFNLLSGKTKEVPWMYQARSFRYFEGDNFQAIILPYGTTSMYVFLPSETPAWQNSNKR